MINYKKLAKKSSQKISEEELEAFSEEERMFVMMCAGLSEDEKAHYVERYEWMDQIAGPKKKGMGCASMIAIIVSASTSLVLTVMFFM